MELENKNPHLLSHIFQFSKVVAQVPGRCPRTLTKCLGARCTTLTSIVCRGPSNGLSFRNKIEELEFLSWQSENESHCEP